MNYFWCDDKQEEIDYLLEQARSFFLQACELQIRNKTNPLFMFKGRLDLDDGAITDVIEKGRVLLANFKIDNPSLFKKSAVLVYCILACRPFFEKDPQSEVHRAAARAANIDFAWTVAYSFCEQEIDLSCYNVKNKPMVQTMHLISLHSYKEKSECYWNQCPLSEIDYAVIDSIALLLETHCYFYNKTIARTCDDFVKQTTTSDWRSIYELEIV